MSDIEIEIDGKKLQAKPDAMVIQVADEAGIYIPRFCYHKHLSVAANCRMCLVEVEKSPKTLPACATPVMPGMKVFTRSPKALAAQKAVMEFLLINHPLDCPICDQGGECELQDLSMGYGSPESYFCEGKRVVKDKDIGPLIATEMTRCIQCTRCVRYGDEVAGFRELGAINRGENMEITTYVTHAMHSEVSGNIIDLCPVGALTSKPYRFTARAWELQQHPTITAHDCLGSNAYAHTRNGSVMRMVPHENIHINETWLSDRDRFSYEGLSHTDRLTKPLVRIGDQWQETDWQTALEAAVVGLQQVIDAEGAEQLGALASPNSTLEEFYLLQKLMRSIGSANIDHRLRQSDFTDQNNMPIFPGMNLSLTDLENCDAILLIGSNIQREQPLAALRLRKAALKGSTIFAVNMMDYQFHFPLTAKNITAPQFFVQSIAKIAKALNPKAEGLEEIVVDEASNNIAEKLRAGKKVCILLGAMAFNHTHSSVIRALAKQISEQTQGTLGFLTEGANAAGAWLAGAIPHREAGARTVSPGLDAHTMWRQERKGYVLLNVEPELDCADPVAAVAALEQANFVVAISTFKNALLEQHAHVILPVTPFTETSGTFVNAMGEWQSFRGVVNALGESRPAWKVFRVLGNLFDKKGFEYESSEEVREEVRALTNATPNLQSEKTAVNLSDLKWFSEVAFARIGEVPLYLIDPIVRRAPALQSTQMIMEGNVSAARIHPETAQALQVKETELVTIKQNKQSIRLPILFDERVPAAAVFIASGTLAGSGLSDLFGSVEINKL